MNEERLEAYLELCERMAQRMLDEGRWPFVEPLHDDDPTLNEITRQNP